MRDSEHALLRARICAVGKSLYQRGYVHATAGNISMRLDDGGFFITPTDACLGNLEPDQLAHVDANDTHLSGEPPSKTLHLHRHIYQAAPHARSVLHTHSTHVVALTLAGVWSQQAVLPPITPYFVMKVGQVPLVPYAVPGDASVAAAVGALAGRAATRAVVLERLGPVVWSESPESASAVLEELEETARIYLLSGRKAPALDSAAVEFLCARFRTNW
ncbi:MAG: aldolase [Gammaproteobacteria bacterium]|nr:aldolase [Gammaproteobacteria bacterium]MBU0816454.1 aldolase [Gammaproteobacteria bacterium]